ncbi:hypothetical protein VTO42DRAFT_2337 [Malbranchea cinnamomea]
MVSFWPWKGSDNSPASFEKTLSNLSSRIAQTTARLDDHRRRSRRFKALWTLYSIFIYLLYSVILILVVGREQWGAVEYAAVAGGPVLIYAVRAAGDNWYQYRISRTQEALDDLQKQRDETIEKLKEATRYNSTLQLLQKYGRGSPGLEPTPEETTQGTRQDDESRPKRRRDPRDRASMPTPGGRTGLAPPPTANIPRNQPSPQPRTPQTPLSNTRPHSPPNYSGLGSPHTPPVLAPSDGPGFHPSAFSTSQHYSQPPTPRWYDRILDVLLGEDETLPQNRLALICAQCRLVNGQAAPGIKTLEEVGRWRCGSCGAWNGEGAAAKHADDGPLRPVHSRTRSQSMPHPTQQAAIHLPAESKRGALPTDNISASEGASMLSGGGNSEQGADSDSHSASGNEDSSPSSTRRVH